MVVYESPETDAPKSPPTDPRQALGAYHAISKHSVGKFAAGPSRLTYATAPSTQRCYEGCATIELPIRSVREAVLPSFRDALYAAPSTPAPLDAASISSLLYHSLALSATKRTKAAEWL